MVGLGLLVGTVFGFVETLLAFGTGTLPRANWPFYFYPGLFGGLMAGVVLRLAQRLSGSRVPSMRQASGLLILAPILIFALRGPADSRAWVGLANWAGSALVAGLSLWVVAASSHLSRDTLLVVALLSQSLAAIGLALREGSAKLLPGTELLLLTALGMGLFLFLLRKHFAALVRTRVPTRRPPATLVAVVLANLAVLPVSRLYGTAPPPLPSFRAGGNGKQHPNLVVVVLDTVRRDHLSLYGYGRRTTPNLDRFADESLTFLAAYATAPYTLASHASLFTGKLPGDHGARQIPYDTEGRRRGSGRDYPLPEEAETLAELLRSRGYRTLAVVANAVYLPGWTGLAQGFEYYDCRPGAEYGYAPLILPLSKHLLPALYNEIRLRNLRSARDITRQALRTLRSVREDPPFFLFVNYMDAHWPYTSPENLLRSFVPDDSWVPWARVATWATADDRVREREPDQREAVIGHYDSAIAFIDEQLGELFGFLERQGLLEDTVVVVTSDHGESLGEHGLVMHDNSLCEEQIRIPLVIRTAGHGKARVDTPVDLRDVHALILRALEGRGLEVAPDAGPEVRAQMWAREPAVGPPFQQASFHESWKLISGGTGPLELYDLSEDSHEKENRVMADSLPEVARELLGAAFPRPADPKGAGITLSQEEEERLRALGYTE